MRSLISGNEAMFLGARKAGADFYAAYPITPANDFIPLALAEKDRDKKFVFFQAEDEIAALMSVYGAGLAGRQAFTATSGPGLDLMQEALGWGYMASVPAVIIDVQRVGPATGMPTYFAQSDILAAVHGTHGDYQSLVFYPGTGPECLQYTARAFQAAAELARPVIVLSDASLARLHVDSDPKEIAAETVVLKQKPLGSREARHWSGLITDRKGIPQTASPKVYKQRLAAKKAAFERIAPAFDFSEYQPNKKSDTLLIAFGFVALGLAGLEKKYAIFRPITLWPIPAKLKKLASEYKRIVVAEASDGQYASLVEQDIKRPVERLAILGGQSHEIINALAKLN